MISALQSRVATLSTNDERAITPSPQRNALKEQGDLHAQDVCEVAAGTATQKQAAAWIDGVRQLLPSDSAIDTHEPHAALAELLTSIAATRL